MNTEYEKMLAGEEYFAADDELIVLLNECKDACWEYNQIRPTKLKERNEKIQQILGKSDDDTFVNQPFYCDYGKHIRVGKRFFANFNLVVLDEAYVTIGDDCFIGPNVSIYTACHSTDPTERNSRNEGTTCNYRQQCLDWWVNNYSAWCNYWRQRDNRSRKRGGEGCAIRSCCGGQSCESY